MASNLSNYGTVTTKDILARRLYNDEIAGTNPLGMIVDSGVQLDIDAGTTIAITAGTNLDISAGAGLDFAVTGMTDLNSTTDVNLESGFGQTGNVIGDFAINSNGAFDVVAGNNASLAITGVFDTQVSSNITIDSSAGAIKIGGDANTGAIEIGKQGARTKMQIGNATVVEIEMNSLLMDLNVGASGLTVDVVGNTVINGAGATTFQLAGTDTNDFTIKQTAAKDSDLVLESAGTNAATAIQIKATAGGMDVNVSADRTLDVGGTNTDTVVGTQTTDITGFTTEFFKAGRTSTVTGAETLNVTAARQLNCTGGSSVETYAVNQTVNVNGDAGYVLDVVANVNIDSAKAAADAIVINASGTGSGIDITCKAGGMDLTSTGGTIDVAGNTGVTIATTAAASAIALTAAGGTTNQISLTSSGLAADAIKINASGTSGGIDIDSLTGGINIKTTGSCVQDTTGDATETVTGNKTVVVDGASGLLFNVDKIIDLNSNDATANAITINASNAAGGINIDSKTGGINITTTGAVVTATTLTTDRTMGGVETITNQNNSVRTVSGLYSVESDAATGIVLNASNAAGGIDIDCGTGGFNVLATGATAEASITGQKGAALKTTLENSNINIIAAGGGASQKLTATCAGTDNAAITVTASAGGIDINSKKVIDINSSDSDINIDVGSAAVTQKITIGTTQLGTKCQIGNITESGTSLLEVKNIKVYGTCEVAGTATQSGDFTVNGNLTVNGTTTTLNTTEITSDDKNIVLNAIDETVITRANAATGGISLVTTQTFANSVWSQTYATFQWDDNYQNRDSADIGAWFSSEDINLANAKLFSINEKKALSQSQCFAQTKSADAGENTAKDTGGIYLNTGTPGTNELNDWRIKVDLAGDVVFQKCDGTIFVNKFRIQ